VDPARALLNLYNTKFIIDFVEQNPIMKQIPPYYATRIQSSDEFLAPISPSRAAKSRDYSDKERLSCVSEKYFMIITGIHTCRHRICPSIESDHWA